MHYDVSLIPCPDYAPDTCLAALTAALEPIGGLDWVHSGMRIGVKVNLVSAMKPEEAATTHPALLCALVKLLKERDAVVVLGDSPGGLYTAGHLARVYDVTGMHQCEALGAQLNQDFSQATAEFPEAAIAKSFQYTAWLDKCDAIIDFCKLKSHGMMGMSNAAKNLFGVIPGTMKPEYHYKYPNAADFARMLVDLNLYFKPRLSICDAVVGMEGNGPTQGTPIQMGLVAASQSPHQLDLACAALLGLSCKDVPTLTAALERGLIPETAQELNIYGDMAALMVQNFHAPTAQSSVFFRYGGDGLFGKVATWFIHNALTSVPAVKDDECIGCGKCASICPAKAITMKNKLPKIDRSHCIHCFCCQEFCPKGAMKVKRPAIAKLLNK